MAAVDPQSRSEAAWALALAGPSPIEVSVPAGTDPRPTGIRVHRRTILAEDRTTHRGIPVTSPVRTLIDLAIRLDADSLEAAVDEADKRDLVDPESLRAALKRRGGQPGVRVLRELLDRRTFVLTAQRSSGASYESSDVRGWQAVDRAVREWLQGGLLSAGPWAGGGDRRPPYHRTAATHARDSVRDQTHTAAG